MGTLYYDRRLEDHSKHCILCNAWITETREHYKVDADEAPGYSDSSFVSLTGGKYKNFQTPLARRKEWVEWLGRGEEKTKDFLFCTDCLKHKKKDVAAFGEKERRKIYLEEAKRIKKYIANREKEIAEIEKNIEKREEELYKIEVVGGYI